jgi:hypothetical protein
MQAAAAHEICHFHRWYNKTELEGERFADVDEALTSLEAILRFQTNLSLHEICQLVADAIHRLQTYTHKLATHRAEQSEQ